MRVLVTGSTGFIGGHVVKQAVAAGHELWKVRGVESTEVESIPESNWISKPMGKIEAEDLMGIEALIHLAAWGVNPANSDWESCFAVNVMESLSLWRAACAAGVRRFVICGSCFEYGRSAERYSFVPVTAPLEPTGPYHASKAAASLAALALSVSESVEVVILRPFHVYGPGEAASRLWRALKNAALSGADFPMTPGEQVRDFVPVETVAKIFVRSLQAKLVAGHPVIANIGTGKPETILDFATRWWTHWGARGRLLPGAVAYRPNEIMRYVPEVDLSFLND